MSATNKRREARIQRELQDLVKRPGNDRCCDCQANGPNWASFSLGIFLCVRCASLHRKLGTHISKVKSLSMDTWTVDQVEHMKQVGNATSNRIYNPRNVKPAIPIDVDEVDGVMERYIRQKYEQKTLSSESQNGSRNHTGSTSSEERAPPPPPKPAKHFSRFGLRSATANFPLSRNAERSPPLSPLSDELYGDRSPPRNKPAKILGADIGSSRDDNIKAKLGQLRDMGFPDEKRNIAVLKGLNGRVDKAVEELIRLGEGGSSNRLASRSNTASTPRASTANGLNVEKSRPANLTPGRGLSFEDMQKSLPPSPLSPEVGLEQQSQSLNRAVSPSAQTNPFLQQPNQSQPQFSLAQSMQQMQISQPPLQQVSQLFPNQTGGYNQQGQTHNPFMQTYQQVPQYQSQALGSNALGTYGNSTAQQQQPPQWQAATGPATQEQSNPFLRTSRSQIFATSTNPFEISNGAQMSAQAPQSATQPSTTQHFFQPTMPQNTSNPFQQPISYQPIETPQYSQQMQQNAQSYWQNSQTTQQQPGAFSPAMTASPAPFQQSQISSSLQQPNGPTYPQQSNLFHQSTYPPIGHDRPSVLDLYGQQSLTSGTSPFGPPSTLNVAASQPQRSFTMPPALHTAPSPFGPPSTQSATQSSGASLFGSLAPPPSTTTASAFTSTLSTQPTGFGSSASPFSNGTNSQPYTPSLGIASSPSAMPQSSTNPFGGPMTSAFPTTLPFAQPTASTPSTTTLSNPSPFAGGPSPFASAPTQSGANPISNGYAQPMTANPAFNSSAFRHVSNESMDFRGMGMSGRHSPDAFASLSSKLR